MVSKSTRYTEYTSILMEDFQGMVVYTQEILRKFQ